MQMTMDEKLEIVKGFLPDMQWFSAGQLAYVDSEKGRKKHLVVPHKDGHKINSQTNTLKAQLNDKYLVIDCDGADLDELAKIYPSTKNTFTTQTTDSHKRHFYFKPVKGIQGVRKTGLEANGEYDIFTTGIMFEGHTIPEQPQEWKVINDSEVTTLTEGEIDTIMHLCRNSVMNSNTPKDTFFVDKETASLVIQSVEEGKLPESKKEHKALMFGICNQDYRDKHKSSRQRVPFPDFNHIDFNTMAYKVSYNMAIGHEVRDAFLNLLLTEAYGVNINSMHTYNHLHKSILATLPRHEVLDAVLDDDEFLVAIQPSVRNNVAIVRFINQQGRNMYMTLNPHSGKPIALGMHGQLFYDAASVVDNFGYAKNDFMLTELVKVINDPYKKLITFDDEANMTCVNLSEQSPYYERATPIPTKPDNVLTRLITSYFGNEYQDFYYHWLAHMMFNDRVPQTIPTLVSRKADRAATGKSSLAQAIPSRLIWASATVDVGSTMSGWGDIVDGKKLVCFNDMQPLTRKAWEPVYSYAKDRTTGGTVRMDNMKFGGFKKSETSTCFSISANWIPPIDEHDRRLWIVFPQTIYATQESLSKEDSQELNHLLEGTKRSDYLEVFQELANYLKYVFSNHRDKYLKELYREAPVTLYRADAMKEQRNYSQTLLDTVKLGAEALENAIGEDNMLFCAKFIVYQWDCNKLYLPATFVSKLLNATKGDSHPVKYTNQRLCDALGLQSGEFKNRGELHTRYKHEPYLKEFFNDDEIFELTGYVNAQLVLDVTEEVLEGYKTYVKQNQNGATDESSNS